MTRRHSIPACSDRPAVPAAFTLIELLVVISILVLLMGLLLPAVIKAKQIFTGVQAREQVMSLAKACNSYASTFDGALPAVLPNPPGNASGTPAQVSGAQAMVLALMGYSAVGGGICREPNGPLASAADPDSRRMQSWYAARRGEMLPHNSNLFQRNSGLDSGYAGNIEVFVDFMWEPARPVLYFQARPGPYYDWSHQNLPCKYSLADNGVYYTAAERSSLYNSSQGKWSDPTFSSSTSPTTDPRSIGVTGLADGFVIISAGPDRQFFTDDDIRSYMR